MSDTRFWVYLILLCAFALGTSRFLVPDTFGDVVKAVLLLMVGLPVWWYFLGGKRRFG